MKTIGMILALALACAFGITVDGQGFANLDFESAYNLPGDPGSGGTFVGATNGLPGWTAYGAALRLNNIYYSSNSFDGTGADVGLVGGSLALSGDFSVVLFDSGSISQTGIVPDNAESLQFEGTSGLKVTLGGQTLSLTALSQGANYTLYGANIPAGLDGQVETLTLLYQGLGEGPFLDNIEFSTSSVPEPGGCGLIALGAALFGVWRHQKRRR